LILHRVDLRHLEHMALEPEEKWLYEVEHHATPNVVRMYVREEARQTVSKTSGGSISGMGTVARSAGTV
jgi:hypothetical protein